MEREGPLKAEGMGLAGSGFIETGVLGTGVAEEMARSATGVALFWNKGPTELHLADTDARDGVTAGEWAGTFGGVAL